MSIITIHCHLHTTEAIRRLLWQVMAESNTPLISALLRQVAEHPDFDTWQTNGSVPIKTVRAIAEPLKAHYPPQPGRFYASAYQMVSYTYESWLAIQKKTKLRLDGKRHWLLIFKSDAELLELTGLSLESLRQSARKVLSELSTQPTTDSPPDTQTKPPKAKSRKSQKQPSTAQDKDLIGKLFKAYAATDDLTQHGILAYLIKNGGTLTDEAETPEAFAHRLHRKQTDIAQLEDRLQARLPKGRDLTGDTFIDTLLIAQQQEPEDVAQMRDWQAKLLMRPADLPYPIRYDSSTDMMWKPDDQGRITVNFNGLEKFLKNSDPEVKAWLKEHKEYPFRIQCDQRQLPYFQRFLTDWQAYQADQANYPAGLLTISSAMLAWRKSKKKRKGEPWNTYQLALYCSFDTRLLTAEGTIEVQ